MDLGEQPSRDREHRHSQIAEGAPDGSMNERPIVLDQEMATDRDRIAAEDSDQHHHQIPPE